MIRFIIDTVSSKPNKYGNCQHFATITSTRTGKTLNVDNVGGPSNAAGLVRKLTGADWSEIHSINIEEPIRRFNTMEQYRDVGMLEHQVNAKILADLEA